MTEIKIRIEIKYSILAKRFFIKNPKIKEKFKTNLDDHFNFSKTIDVVPIKGKKGFLRMRIGDFRIIYKVEKNEIVIVEVFDAGSRGNIYDKF